jgi:hypothetical protein
LEKNLDRAGGFRGVHEHLKGKKRFFWKRKGLYWRIKVGTMGKRWDGPLSGEAGFY